MDATNKKKAVLKSEESKLVAIYNTPLTAPETLLLKRVLLKVGARPNLYKKDLGDAVQQEVLALLARGGELNLAGFEDAVDGIGAIIAATHLPVQPLEAYGAPDVGIRPGKGAEPGQSGVAGAINGAAADGNAGSHRALSSGDSSVGRGGGDAGDGTTSAVGFGTKTGVLVGELPVDKPEESIAFAGRMVTRSELLKVAKTNNPFQLYVRRAELCGVISFDEQIVKVARGVAVGNVDRDRSTATTTTTTVSPAGASTRPGTGSTTAAAASNALVSPRLINGAEVSGMLDFSATSSVALDDSVDRFDRTNSPALAVLDLQNLQPASCGGAAMLSPTTPGHLGIDDFPTAFGEVVLPAGAYSPVLASSDLSAHNTNGSNSAFEDLDFSLMAAPAALTPEPGNSADGESDAAASNGGDARPYRVSQSSYNSGGSPDALTPLSGRTPSGGSGSGSGSGGGGGALAASTPNVPASPISIAPGWTQTKAPADDRAGSSSKRHKLVQWDGAEVKVVKYKVVKPTIASNYVLFVLTVCDPFGDAWQVERRYSDFEKLHSKLTGLKFTKPLEPMPGKSLMKLSDDVSRERMIQFQKILDQCKELEDAHNETEALKSFLSHSWRDEK